MSTTAAATTAILRLDILHQVTLSRYFVGVSLTLSIYDWLLLLHKESQTTWKTRRSWSKLIYYNNRVLNLLGLIVVAITTSDLWKHSLSYQFCKFYVWFPLPLEWLSFLLGNVIFTLRVIALYNRNQLVLRALYLLLFLCWTSSFGFTLHTLIRITPTIYYSPVYHACVTDTPLSLVAGVFLGPALFESTLFLLTLSRAILYTRQMRVLSNFQTPFLTTLYRDGFYYFLAVVAVHLWNVIAYWTQPVKGNYMGTHFAWTVMTVMSSRVYLNLVRAAYGGDEDEDEDEDENDEEREDTGGGRGLSTTTTTAGLRHPQRKRQWIRCSTATAVPMQEFGVSPERRGRGGRDPSSLEERGLHQHQRHQQLVTLPPPPPMATTTTIEADFKDADDDSTKQPP